MSLHTTVRRNATPPQIWVPQLELVNSPALGGNLLKLAGWVGGVGLAPVQYVGQFVAAAGGWTANANEAAVFLAEPDDVVSAIRYNNAAVANPGDNAHIDILRPGNAATLSTVVPSTRFGTLAQLQASENYYNELRPIDNYYGSLFVVTDDGGTFTQNEQPANSADRGVNIQVAKHDIFYLRGGRAFSASVSSAYWVRISSAGGAAYTAGDGIDISAGNAISVEQSLRARVLPDSSGVDNVRLVAAGPPGQRQGRWLDILPPFPSGAARDPDIRYPRGQEFRRDVNNMHEIWQIESAQTFNQMRTHNPHDTQHAGVYTRKSSPRYWIYADVNAFNAVGRPDMNRGDCVKIGANWYLANQYIRGGGGAHPHFDALGGSLDLLTGGSGGGGASAAYSSFESTTRFDEDNQTAFAVGDTFEIRTGAGAGFYYVKVAIGAAVNFDDIPAGSVERLGAPGATAAQAAAIALNTAKIGLYPLHASAVGVWRGVSGNPDDSTFIQAGTGQFDGDDIYLSRTDATGKNVSVSDLPAVGGAITFAGISSTVSAISENANRIKLTMAGAMQPIAAQGNKYALYNVANPTFDQHGVYVKADGALEGNGDPASPLDVKQDGITDVELADDAVRARNIRDGEITSDKFDMAAGENRTAGEAAVFRANGKVGSAALGKFKGNWSSGDSYDEGDFVTHDFGTSPNVQYGLYQKTSGGTGVDGTAPSADGSPWALTLEGMGDNYTAQLDSIAAWFKGGHDARAAYKRGDEVVVIVNSAPKFYKALNDVAAPAQGAADNALPQNDAANWREIGAANDFINAAADTTGSAENARGIHLGRRDNTSIIVRTESSDDYVGVSIVGTTLTLTRRSGTNPSVITLPTSGGGSESTNDVVGASFNTANNRLTLVRRSNSNPIEIDLSSLSDAAETGAGIVAKLAALTGENRLSYTALKDQLTGANGVVISSSGVVGLKAPTAWSANTQYGRDERVTHGGNLYAARVDIASSLTNASPDNDGARWWLLSGAGGGAGGGSYTAFADARAFDDDNTTAFAVGDHFRINSGVEIGLYYVQVAIGAGVDFDDIPAGSVERINDTVAAALTSAGIVAALDAGALPRTKIDGMQNQPDSRMVVTAPNGQLGTLAIPTAGVEIANDAEFEAGTITHKAPNVAQVVGAVDSVRPVLSFWDGETNPAADVNTGTNATVSAGSSVLQAYDAANDRLILSQGNGAANQVVASWANALIDWNNFAMGFKLERPTKSDNVVLMAFFGCDAADLPTLPQSHNKDEGFAFEISRANDTAHGLTPGGWLFGFVPLDGVNRGGAAPGNNGRIAPASFYNGAASGIASDGTNRHYVSLPSDPFYNASEVSVILVRAGKLLKMYAKDASSSAPAIKYAEWRLTAAQQNRATGAAYGFRGGANNANGQLSYLKEVAVGNPGMTVVEEAFRVGEPQASGGGEDNVQADWTESDNTSDAFIRNKPSIPAAQVPADWDASSGVARILNKPAIPAAQVPADWDADSGVARILNKPTIPEQGVRFYRYRSVSGEAPRFNGRSVNFARGDRFHIETGAEAGVYTALVPTAGTTNFADMAENALSRDDNLSAISAANDDLTGAPTESAGTLTFPRRSGTPYTVALPDAVQANWTESDNNDDAFIRNKPPIVDGVQVSGGNLQLLAGAQNVGAAVALPSGGGGVDTTIYKGAHSRTSAYAIGDEVLGTDGFFYKAKNAISSATLPPNPLPQNDAANWVRIDNPAQVPSNWNATTGVERILNKPAIVDGAEVSGGNLQLKAGSANVGAAVALPSGGGTTQKAYRGAWVSSPSPAYALGDYVSHIINSVTRFFVFTGGSQNRAPDGVVGEWRELGELIAEDALYDTTSALLSSSPTTLNLASGKTLAGWNVIEVCVELGQRCITSRISAAAFRATSGAFGESVEIIPVVNTQGYAGIVEIYRVNDTSVGARFYGNSALPQPRIRKITGIKGV